MKAILVNDDKSLRWDEVENPVMKKDEVLVEIHAAALNRADLMQREGDYQKKFSLRVKTEKLNLLSMHCSR